MGIVSGGIFILRQKIFKGKIIFLVCCFRSPIKTVFSYVLPSFLGRAGAGVLREGLLAPRLSGRSPRSPELHRQGGASLRGLAGEPPGVSGPVPERSKPGRVPAWRQATGASGRFPWAAAWLVA